MRHVSVCVCLALSLCVWTRQNKTRQDKTKPDKPRQDKTRRDKTRQDKTRQDTTRQDKTRQDKARQGKTRRDKCRVLASAMICCSLQFFLMCASFLGRTRTLSLSRIASFVAVVTVSSIAPALPSLPVSFLAIDTIKNIHLDRVSKFSSGGLVRHGLWNVTRGVQDDCGNAAKAKQRQDRRRS